MPPEGGMSSTRASLRVRTLHPRPRSACSPRLPILLRLTRRGNTVTRQYSTDEGRTFRSAGPPVTFDRPLPKRLYIGLASAAGDRRQISEATFTVPSIQ